MWQSQAVLDAFFHNDPTSAVQRTRALVGQRLHQAANGIILYGAGHYGRIAAAALRRQGTPARAFIDRDPNKWGHECAGLPVIGFDESVHEILDNTLIVVTVFNCIAVLKDLARHGVDAITYAQLATALGEPLMPFCGIQDPTLLWEHETAIRDCLRLWADEASRQEYVSQLLWSFNLDPFQLPQPRPVVDTYFEPSLIHLGNREVFIDCGAFDGDTVAAFRTRCPDYEAIVALEPDPTNRKRFLDRFGGPSPMDAARITILPYAAADRRETVPFDVTGTAGSAIVDTGLHIHAAPLDDIVAIPSPTFIKMDVEGAEPRALTGAVRLLSHHKPRLAICLYHDRRHLWEIPLQIATIQPQYSLHLRRYADECWELICYGL